VDLIITEKCVFEVNKTDGLTLIEIADGVQIPDILNITGCEFKVCLINCSFLFYFIIFSNDLLLI
jgi:acyl CoA:acetate/3-ketoacid CoA transferase beta subunit